MFDTLSGNNLHVVSHPSTRADSAIGTQPEQAAILCVDVFLDLFAFNSHLTGNNCDMRLFSMLGTLALNISAHANRRSIDGGFLEVPYDRRSIAAIVASPPGPVLPLGFPVLLL